MRTILGLVSGWVVVASAVPTAGLQACAEVPDSAGGVELRIASPGLDLRAVCLAERETELHVDPLRDTFPVTAGERLALDGPCGLVVYRRDGALWARSPVHPVSPTDVVVDVALPADPIAGLGIRYRPGFDGVRVEWVQPGTPASGHLFPGDVITAVDGFAVTGHVSTWAFAAMATGPIGTRTTLAVDGAEGTRRVELERDLIAVYRDCSHSRGPAPPGSDTFSDSRR